MRQLITVDNSWGRFGMKLHGNKTKPSIWDHVDIILLALFFDHMHKHPEGIPDTFSSKPAVFRLTPWIATAL
jgi:hypothetical protein